MTGGFPQARRGSLPQTERVPPVLRKQGLLRLRRNLSVGEEGSAGKGGTGLPTLERREGGQKFSDSLLRNRAFLERLRRKT